MINKHRPHRILHMCTYINCLRSHVLTRDKLQKRTSELCPLYHQNAQHYWWGCKPHSRTEWRHTRGWKRKKMWLHVFHYFHTQSNNNMYHGVFFLIYFIFVCLEDGTSAISARFKKKTGRNAWPVSFYIYVDIHIHISTYTYLFFSVSGFVYMIYMYIAV